MGVALLSAASGLNKADQQTVKDWMVEGHSIMNGKVVGTVPNNGATNLSVPIGSSVAIPVGYYDGNGEAIGGNLKDTTVTTSGGSGTVTLWGDGYYRYSLNISANKTADNTIVVTARTVFSDSTGDAGSYTKYNRTVTCTITV